ncbi:CDP-diacylglycerol--glycerol-3-phosphate 3-phosphatidyltransferase [Oscillospiraceae bacterium OttesenSCG-928-G22]|nr:CDP-diacylglycerol--glycerol-3-phosphate 3-phosphatidyltransferase [Oscillospiraceae bacterium OttesenSCG-928-G22]
MNLPNILSAIRIVLVPVFVAVFFGDSPNAHRNAAIIYLTASLTDILDGFIARRFHLVTRLGRILDPLADKLMTATVFICSAIDGIIPIWAVILFAAKECVMGAGALFMYRRVKDVMPSNVLGKATTVVFFLVLTALLLFSIPKPYSTIIIAAALALMFVSLAIYAYQLYHIIRKTNSPEDSQ